MFLVLKLLVFYIWCCDGMRLGVQVKSACLVDASVSGRVASFTVLGGEITQLDVRRLLRYQASTCGIFCD